MTKALYMDDAYCKEFEAGIVETKDGKLVVLDTTAFYPQGGGQPFDTGTIHCNGIDYEVTAVRKADGNITHEVAATGLQAGDKINGKINWERRYTFMRMHTACHIISAIFHTKTGALITGNQIGLDETRVDFSLENFDREKINEYIALANQIIARDILVKVFYLPREEALQRPGMVKLAGALPPDVKNLRIVEIEGVDTQADGGTHVRTLKEIGTIELSRIENKGKNNRRVYFKLLPTLIP